ncbi:MAG TPA: ATP-binding protein [Bryobacteraceae bacterium]|nr:ATP-binding protein [Bryobacteraceae bacterium]
MKHLCRFAFVASLLWSSAFAARRVVIGYTENPPLTSLGLDQKPAGFLVDALNAAGKKAGIEIEWRLLPPGSNMTALASGDIDMWPGGVSSSDRRRRFHLTSPWWNTELLAVTRSKLVRFEDLRGKTVARVRTFAEEFPRWLQGVKAVDAQTQRDGLIGVCTSAVDGVLLDRIMLDNLLLRRPQECDGVQLSAMVVPGATVELHIIARPAAEAAAEDLHGALQSLTNDGTLAELSLHYPSITAASAGSVTAMFRLQYRYRLFRAALIVLSIALGLGIWTIVRLRSRNRKLMQTEAELIRANADLKQFAYAASHDLSEPIRNMTLFAQLLERRYKGKLDSTADQQIGFITDGAQRMLRLLQDLLAYTNLGASQTLPTPISLQEVLDDVLSNLASLIERSNACIEISGLPDSRVHRVHMMQLFQNLIQNAIKYADKQPVISVSAELKDDQWIFTVSDNGPGIKPEFHDTIFAMFKRLHGREVSGSGVGLALCRRVIDSYGGTIWVESEDGRGSKFRFALPAKLFGPSSTSGTAFARSVVGVGGPGAGGGGD